MIGFGFSPTTSKPGLIVTIGAGYAVINNVVTSYAAGDISLQANATNYIYLNTTSGVIQTSTSGFLAGSYPICSVRTTSTAIAELDDMRPDVFGSGSSAPVVSLQGIQAANYGVTGNGYFRLDAVSRFFTLTQVTVTGGTTTYTGTITGGAANALVGYKFAITGFLNSGNNVTTMTVTASTATTLVCATTTQSNETHAGNAGSFTIDSPSSKFTTQAKVGQIVFATDLSKDGYTVSSKLVVPQGTITAINSDTQIEVSLACNALGGQTYLVWGDDQTTNMTNAWNACKAAVTTLILPGVNPQGDGPAIILVQTAQLNAPASPAPGTGGNRAGLGARGGGVNATYIVPTPNFDFSTTTNNACFLAVPDGGMWQDFQIHGAGVSAPGAALGSKIGALITASNNTEIRNLAFTFWGNNITNGIGVGLQLGGGNSTGSQIMVDGFGQVGVKHVSGTWSMNGLVVYDNSYINLWIAPNATPSPFISMGGFYGGNAGETVCLTDGAIMYSLDDMFHVPSEASNNCILVGWADPPSGNIHTGNNTLYMNGGRCVLALGSGAHILYLNAASDTAVLSNCYFKNSTGAASLVVTNNGTLTDAGGNTFIAGTSTTMYSGTGTLIKQVKSEASVDLTAQAAILGPTTILAVPAGNGLAGAGMYRISYVAKVTQAATTSSTLGGFQVVYTDKDDSVVVTTLAGPTSTLNTTQAVVSGDFIVSAKASTNIQYIMGYVSSGATPMQFNLHIKVEEL